MVQEDAGLVVYIGAKNRRLPGERGADRNADAVRVAKTDHFAVEANDLRVLTGAEKHHFPARGQSAPVTLSRESSTACGQYQIKEQSCQRLRAGSDPPEADAKAEPVHYRVAVLTG